LGVKPALSKKQVYGIIATSLVVCLSVSVFFSLQLNVDASLQSQHPQTTPKTTATPNPTATPTNQTVDNPTNTPLPSPTKTPLMTEDDALAMATPLIEQYASENNRTITSIKATFYPSYTDLDKVRGSASTCVYPEWTVEATFASLGYLGLPLNGPPPNDIQYFIYGFIVGIWADNHQLWDTHPQAVA
jgi:hypothetical protein